MDLRIKNLGVSESRKELSQGQTTISSEDNDVEFNFISTTTARSAEFSGFKREKTSEIKDILVVLEQNIEATHRGSLSPEEVFETKKIISDWIINNLKNIEQRIKNLNDLLAREPNQIKRTQIAEEIKKLEEEQFNCINLPKKTTYQYDITEEEPAAKIESTKLIESDLISPELVESVQILYYLYEECFKEHKIDLQTWQQMTNAGSIECIRPLKQMIKTEISKEDSLAFSKLLSDFPNAVLEEFHNKHSVYFNKSNESRRSIMETSRNDFATALIMMKKIIIEKIYIQYKDSFLAERFTLDELQISATNIPFKELLERMTLIVNSHKPLIEKDLKSTKNREIIVNNYNNYKEYFIESKLDLEHAIELGNHNLNEALNYMYKHAVDHYYVQYKMLLLESGISLEGLYNKNGHDFKEILNIIRTTVIEKTYNQFRNILSSANISKEQMLELGRTSFKQALNNIRTAVIDKTYNSYKYFFHTDLLPTSKRLSLELWQEKAGKNFENTLHDMRKQVVDIIYKKYEHIFAEFPIAKIKEIMNLDFDLTIEALYIIINFKTIDSWISDRKTITEYSPNVPLPASPSFARTLMLSNATGEEIGVSISKKFIKDGLKRLLHAISSEGFKEIKKEFTISENIEADMALINFQFKTTASSIVNKCATEMNGIINRMFMDSKQIQNLIIEYYLRKNPSIFIKTAELAETSLVSYYNEDEFNSFELDLYTFNNRIVNNLVKFWLTTKVIDFTKHGPIIMILDQLPDFMTYHETLRELSYALIYDMPELVCKYTKLAASLSNNNIVTSLKEYFDFTISYLKNIDTVVKSLKNDKGINEIPFNLSKAQEDLNRELKNLHCELIKDQSYKLDEKTAEIYTNKMRAIILKTHKTLQKPLSNLVENATVLKITEPEYYRGLYNHHFPRNTLSTLESEHYQEVRIASTEFNLMNRIKEKLELYTSKCGVLNFLFHNSERNNAKAQLEKLAKIEQEIQKVKNNYLVSEKIPEAKEKYFKYITETESEVLLVS